MVRNQISRNSLIEHEVGNLSVSLAYLSGRDLLNRNFDLSIAAGKIEANYLPSSLKKFRNRSFYAMRWLWL